MQVEQLDVAILMTAHDAEATVSEALESVVASGEPLAAAVVVLDGCTDGTEATVRRIAERDSRIQVVPMPRIGRGPSLNVGLDLVEVPYVAILDADDLMAASRLGAQATALSRMGPEVAALACGAVDRPNHLDAPSESEVDGAIDRSRDITALLRRGNPIVHSSVLFRTDALRAIGGYDIELRGCFDYGVYIRLAAAGFRIRRLPLRLVVAQKSTCSFFEGRGGFAYRLGAVRRQVEALRTVPGDITDWLVWLVRVAYLGVPGRLRARRRLGALARGTKPE